MTHWIPISAILLAAALGAQSIDRTKPPETPPLAAYKLPPVAESALANGLRVVMVEDRRFPLVTLRLAFSAGSKFDQKLQSPKRSRRCSGGYRQRTSHQIAERGPPWPPISIRFLPTTWSSVPACCVKREAAGPVADLAHNASFPEVRSSCASRTGNGTHRRARGRHAGRREVRRAGLRLAPLRTDSAHRRIHRAHRPRGAGLLSRPPAGSQQRRADPDRRAAAQGRSA
jgi:hypothetical protein